MEVGIDIERITPFEKMGELSKQIIPQSLHLDINNQYDDINMFYKWWTRKEAVLKAKGTGFIHSRKGTISGQILDNHYVPDMKLWKIADVASPINYTAAVCLACDWDVIQLHYWKPCSNEMDTFPVEQVISSYLAIDEKVIPERNHFNEFLQLG